MKRILFTILIIISLTGDSYSQRIPFAFWNRLDPDTLELDAPTLIAPADDTTGVDQSPLLDWDGVIYATNYIVQLDNDTNFSPVSWTDTTVNSKAIVELGLVQGTTWYWRVLAFNIFDTSEWSVTYSFTVTTGPALTTPTLVLPRDDTTNVIQYPVLDWDTVINVRHYVVQLSDTISFADIYWSDSLTQSTSTVDSVLDYASTWYWRVIAYNDFDTSDWSAIYTFTVQDPTIAAPTLITPANNAAGQSQSPTLVWSATDEADFYNVQLTQYSDFSSVLWNQNTFDTLRLVDMTLLEGTKWYWRARAINAVDTSNWSSTFAFIVTEGAATARTYYVDSTGGKDEYNGRSTTTPWQTLAKVTSMTLVPGDTVLLKGGQTFTGGIRHLFTHNDTTSINYGSYGTGKAKIQLSTSDSIGVNIQFTQHVKVNIRNLIIAGIYDPVTETGGANRQIGIYFWNFTTISPIDSNKISQFNVSNCEIYNIKTGISVVPGDFGKTITCKIDSNHVYNIGDGAIGMSFNWHSNSRIYANIIHDVYGYSSDNYATAIVTTLCKDVAIERNLIYNIGGNPIYSGLGIITGASKNIRVRYNEIYGILNNNYSDAEAIDFENGSDSCLAEFNYIHDSPGMGILISGASSETAITNNYKTYATSRGSIDSGSSDYNVIRYNYIKNMGNTSDGGFTGITMSSGRLFPSKPGKNNQIYNNTIIFTSYRTSYGISLNGTNDSTKIFNNLIIGDSTLYFLVDSVESKRYAYINNNMYWDRDKQIERYQIGTPYTFCTSIGAWNAATGWESTRYIYNPLLTSPYSSIGDTLNNPFLIETITKYIPVDGSITRSAGVQLSSYTRNDPTTDIRGLSISGNIGIGACIDTTSSPYIYSDETKRWIGRMDTLQTSNQMIIKDNFIKFLKDDTLLQKADLFYVFANLDSTSAKINIKNDSFNIVSSGSPIFQTQSGFTGNGTSSFLNTVWSPSTNGVNYVKDSATASIYCMSNISENKYIMGTGSAGVDFIRINPKNTANNIEARINESGSNTVTNDSTVGLFSVVRTAANIVNIYKNDSLYSTTSNASSGLTNQTLMILARNSVGTAADFTTRKVSFAYIGKKLNSFSIYRLTDNLNWYLNEIGTPILPLKPLLTSPTNADTGVSLTTDLKWANMNNKNSFHIQVSYAPTFSTLVGEMTDVDTNVYHIGGSNPGSLGDVTLVNNMIHYWRVRAVNSTGTGPWSQTFNFTTPTDFAPESVALFTRFPYAISIDRKYLIDSLIKQLKSDTIWSKADILYMYAADDTSNAKLNWINSSYTSTLSGSTKPTFTVNQGFTGNGTTAYIKTGWIPNTHGVNYILDSASAFIYIGTNVKENACVFGTGGAGVNFLKMIPQNTSNQLEARINENGISTTSNYNPVGLHSIIRYNSSTFKVYKNDSLKNTVSNSSSGRSAYELYILARNAVGTPIEFTTRKIAFFMAGGKYTDYQQTKINRRIEWYLNRLGACVTVPSYVILNTPANSATGVDIATDFDWDNVGADYYQIEIDDDIAFGSPYYSANTAGSEEINDNIGGFSANTTYYWRVRGVNTIGTGTWSSTYSFTTAP